MSKTTASYYLDTDMGNDDMLAIAMLLSRGVKIRGISTVFGVATANRGADNLSRLLEYLGKNIPIYIGSTKALSPDWKASFPSIDCKRANNLTLLEEIALPKSKANLKGDLDQLANAIVSESSLVNLIAIGPLTNIATLIRKYGKEFTEKINSLIIMGGALKVPGIVPPSNLSEYNIYLDPQAAKIVFDNGIPITLIPIDATSFVPVSNEVASQAQKLIPSSKEGSIIKALTLNNKGDFNSYYDPLLAGYLINRSITTKTIQGNIDVTTKGNNIGQTKITENKKGNVTAVVEVNPEKFNQLLLSCIKEKEKTLLISATHGDEGFSLALVRKMSQKYGVDYIIGNPRALKKNVRYCEADLNRSGPGDVKSDKYEVRRAKQVISKASRYDVTLDIHGTVANSGIFIILSDPNWQNLELAKKLDVANVVMWPGLMPTGPMSQFINNCVEIECGPKNSKTVLVELEQILTKYFEGKQRQVKQNIFIVTGQLKGEWDQDLQDFKKTRKYGDPFYPLLSGQYPGITCYKMQRLNDTL